MSLFFALWVWCLSFAGIHQYPVYNYTAAGQDFTGAVVSVCGSPIDKECAIALIHRINDHYVNRATTQS